MGGTGFLARPRHSGIGQSRIIDLRTRDLRFSEFVDHLHEHFKHPCVVRNAAYMPPEAPGFSIEMKAESIAGNEYARQNGAGPR
jgi:L-fuconate dehydratase